MKISAGYVTGYGARRAREAKRPSELVEKALAQLPTLTGDEAVHNDALQRAMAAVTELVQQELDEEGGEIGCLQMLMGIGQALLDYAMQEAAEYGSDDDQDQPDAGYVSYARAPALKASDVAGLVWKSFSSTTKAVDAAQGVVEAIVNVGSVLDAQDDVLEPGAWLDVIREMKAGTANYPAVCWGHDWSDIRGMVLEAEELMPGDSRLPEDIRKAGGGGLRIRAKYALETQAGADAFNLVKGGFVRDWSVGFEPDPDRTRFDKGVRFIGKVRRWPEVSNVLLGASQGTRTTSAKAGAFVMPMLDPVRLDAEGEAMVEAFMAKHFGSATEELVPSFIARHSMDPAIAGPAHAQRAAMEAAVNRRYVDGPGPNYSDAEWDTKIERFGGYPNSLGAGPARRWTDEDSPETTPRVPEQWQLGRVERMVGVR